jgi:hypothetical protein
MKKSLWIIGGISILLFAVNCSRTNGVAQKEQLLERSKPKRIGDDCYIKYGKYPRDYPSYNEFKRCEFKK